MLNYEFNVPLAPHTTFQVGGPADVFVTVHHLDELAQVLKEAQLPIFILGGGSNLLISDDGLRAVVIQLSGEFAQIKVHENGKRITVGAGVSFPKLTRLALELGWTAALGWNGTPGQVGGALKMNAGTRLGEIGQVVESVSLMNAQGPIVLQKSEIGYSYRHSNFPSGYVITSAELKYDDADATLAAQLLARAQELTVARKLSQPKMRSAGSIFKNPPGDFAGRLIEAAGLKGAMEGQAQVSTVHANFIVNTGGAKAIDIYRLSDRIQKEVCQKFNIQLEYEVKLIGEFPFNSTGQLCSA